MNTDLPRQIIKRWGVLNQLREWGKFVDDAISTRGSLSRQHMKRFSDMPRPDWSAIDSVLTDGWRFFDECVRLFEVIHPVATLPGSQDGEDEIIARLLPEHGVYVDIGAGEPVECSNTWRLYERGWRGLLVEPLPWRLPGLALQRPGDHLCPVAILDYVGHATLRLDGSCSSVLETWKINDHGSIVVPCWTAAHLFTVYPQFTAADYVNIDTEGAEGLVLAGWPWDRCRPLVMSLEHLEYNPHGPAEDLSPGWIQHMTEHGYVVHAKTRFNTIFTRAA